MAKRQIDVTIPMPEPIAERLFNVEARLGKVIYLPAAHDGEKCIEDLEDFFFRDIESDSVASEFERYWPGFNASIEQFYGANEDLGDRDRIPILLDFLQSFCPALFLVRAEFTIKKITSRSGDYPCGSYLSGWGYYRTQWLLSNTIEEACERAIELADAQRRTAWDACKPEKAKKPHKDKAVRRKP